MNGSKGQIFIQLNWPASFVPKVSSQNIDS